MELKLRCHCGQKFKFDLEPINGRMPFAVKCPTCGTDGTDAANVALAQMFPEAMLPPPIPALAPIPIPVAPAPATGLRVSQTHAPVMSAAAPPPMMSEPARYVQKSAMPTAAPRLQGNIFLGALGAFLGATLGVGIVVGLAVAMGFGLSLLIIVIGLLSGAGARIAYRGSDSSLGGIAAIITLIASAGTLFFLFGFGAIMSIMALLISVSSAWKIGSG